MWRSAEGGVVMLTAMAVAVGLTVVMAQNNQNKPQVVPPDPPAVDPGPRNDAPDGGGPIAGLTPAELAAFNNGLIQFAEDEPVPDVPPGSANGGLGPGYNGTSCAACHAQPAELGSAVAPFSPQLPGTKNPQIAMANENGATNTIPSFITANGPTREARFIRNPDGSADGGVHNLFTIAGRLDAPGCTLQQPDFATNLAQNNVIFRIPTPLFGLGLVEATTDSTFEANLAATAAARAALGIGGRFNRMSSQHSWKHDDDWKHDGDPPPATAGFNPSGNDGTIMKFGWKAQNKSLTIFAAEAYNVEIGVTNDLFPNERNEFTGCMFNALPEDSHATAIGGESDVDTFVDAMRYSAAEPPNSTFFPDSKAGSALFKSIGCILCHSSTLTSGPSTHAALNTITYHPWSDFAIHHMGDNLADGVRQGQAGLDEFRTAPLWGAGQRLFFLHDGRTTDILDAIQEHKSRGSESNQVIDNFNGLTPAQQQSVLDFVRSL